jgi:hypothetical protein
VLQTGHTSIAVLHRSIHIVLAPWEKAGSLGRLAFFVGERGIAVLQMRVRPPVAGPGLAPEGTLWEMCPLRPVDSGLPRASIL